ncbi:hypothetical protein PM082_007549 [Marasmius tenuissimus]|nr:hypothetical protein PM082_007549 [Marasmius tenuissimus]
MLRSSTSSMTHSAQDNTAITTHLSSLSPLAATHVYKLATRCAIGRVASSEIQDGFSFEPRKVLACFVPAPYCIRLLQHDIHTLKLECMQPQKLKFPYRESRHDSFHNTSGATLTCSTF